MFVQDNAGEQSLGANLKPNTPNRYGRTRSAHLRPDVPACVSLNAGFWGLEDLGHFVCCSRPHISVVTRWEPGQSTLKWTTGDARTFLMMILIMYNILGVMHA